MSQIVIATNNFGKLYEIGQILKDMDIQFIRPADLALALEVEETGSTYAENAELKAVACVQATGLISLGDDSGLEVDALGGAPGLYAHRYAGPDATDSDRYELLLSRLSGVPMERRAARFRCVVAIARPGGEVEFAEGAVEGRIALEPAGSNGFGYDPVFWLDEHGCTMAQLPDEVKNTVSHRGRALIAARPLIVAALQAAG